jgi:hypothetical protein
LDIDDEAIGVTWREFLAQRLQIRQIVVNQQRVQARGELKKSDHGLARLALCQ